MTEAGASWLRILDRELLLSGFCHDVRGPVTALHGYAELEAAPEGAPIYLAIDRLTEMLACVPFTPRRSARADLADAFAVPSTTVWVDHGFAPLRVALAAFPTGPPTLELTDELAWLVVPELPCVELRTDWTISLIRQWMVRPGPGHAGARLRIAARLAGATTAHFVAPEDAARGVLRIAFARAPA